MTANRDTANEIYAPKLRSRLVAGIDSAPTLETDGFDCTGFNFLLVSSTLITATAHQFKLWMWDGVYWKLREDTESDNLNITVTDFDPTADFTKLYPAVGFLRYATEYTVVTGGTLMSVENLSV